MKAKIKIFLVSLLINFITYVLLFKFIQNVSAVVFITLGDFLGTLILVEAAYYILKKQYNNDDVYYLLVSFFVITGMTSFGFGIFTNINNKLFLAIVIISSLSLFVVTFFKDILYRLLDMKKAI